MTIEAKTELDTLNARIEELVGKFQERGIADPAMVAGMHPIHVPANLDALEKLLIEKEVVTEEELRIAKAKSVVFLLESHLENVTLQQREQLTAGIPKMRIPGSKPPRIH
jgi:hypothetical protein